MAWLPFYAADDDLGVLLGRINEDEELAFIISDGPRRWRAVPALPELKPGRYCLWHVPSGPLPLLRPAKENVIVPNAWQGWQEERTGADPNSPYFGAGHPGVFWINVTPDSFDKLSELRGIGLSSFEWIGNRYRLIGNGATEQTERAWKRLGQWMRKLGTKIPRGGPNVGGLPTIAALPSAYRLLKSTAVVSRI